MENLVQEVKEDIRRVIKNYKGFLRSIDVLDNLNIFIRRSPEECKLYEKEKQLLREIYGKIEHMREESEIVLALSGLLDRVTEYIASTDGCNLYICPGYFKCDNQERGFVLLHEAMHILRGDTLLKPVLVGPKNAGVIICGAKVEPISEMHLHAVAHMEVKDFDIRYLGLLPALFDIISDAQVNSQIMFHIRNFTFTHCKPMHPDEVNRLLSRFYGRRPAPLAPTRSREPQENILNKPILELVYLLFRHIHMSLSLSRRFKGSII